MYLTCAFFKLQVVLLVFFGTWMKTLGIDLLTVLHILYYYYYNTGSVVFNSQPQDTTVTEGSDVRFQCSFKGSVRIPDWKINGTLYYWQYVPLPFIFHLSDFSLTVENVDVSLNGTAIQCIIPGVAESSVGWLMVLRNATVLHASKTTLYYTIPYISTENLPIEVQSGKLYYMSAMMILLRDSHLFTCIPQ